MLRHSHPRAIVEDGSAAGHQRRVRCRLYIYLRNLFDCISAFLFVLFVLLFVCGRSTLCHTRRDRDEATERDHRSTHKTEEPELGLSVLIPKLVQCTYLQCKLPMRITTGKENKEGADSPPSENWFKKGNTVRCGIPAFTTSSG